MKVRYDPSVDILYIEIKDAEITNSDELQEGMIADYDEAGNIVGLEIMDASETVSDPDRIEYRVPSREAVAA